LERYILVGTIRPERAALNLTTIATLATLDSGNSLEIDVSIILSQLRVTVLSPQAIDKFDLRNIVSGVLRDLLAQLGFLWGVAYRVEIDRLLSESAENDWVFGVDIAGLTRELNLEDVSGQLLLMRELYSREEGRYLQRALRDLISAMEEPFDTEFYCYRAMEALMLHHNFIVGTINSNPAAKWTAFRDFSGIEESGLRRLQRISEELRHGNFPSEDRDAAFRFESLKFAWDSVSAYLSACSPLSKA
jgi:hypothetical protein